MPNVVSWRYYLWGSPSLLNYLQYKCSLCMSLVFTICVIIASLFFDCIYVSYNSFARLHGQVNWNWICIRNNDKSSKSSATVIDHHVSNTANIWGKPNDDFQFFLSIVTSTKPWYQKAGYKAMGLRLSTRTKNNPEYCSSFLIRIYKDCYPVLTFANNLDIQCPICYIIVNVTFDSF